MSLNINFLFSEQQYHTRGRAVVPGSSTAVIISGTRSAALQIFKYYTMTSSEILLKLQHILHYSSLISGLKMTQRRFWPVEWPLRQIAWFFGYETDGHCRIKLNSRINISDLTGERVTECTNSCLISVPEICIDTNGAKMLGEKKTKCKEQEFLSPCIHESISLSTHLAIHHSFFSHLRHLTALQHGDLPTDACFRLTPYFCVKAIMTAASRLHAASHSLGYWEMQPFHFSRLMGAERGPRILNSSRAVWSLQNPMGHRTGVSDSVVLAHSGS